MRIDFLVFQMGIIFHFDDFEKRCSQMLRSPSASWTSLQLGNLHLEEPKPIEQEEQPPAIYMFLSGLEDTVEAGAAHGSLRS